MPSDQLTLMEELMLLSLDDEKGFPRSSDALPYGLAGALLLEMAFAGRVRLDEDFVEVADPKPTGDALLDEALALIRGSDRRQRVKKWVAMLPRKLKALPRRVAERLVDRGIVKEEEGKVLWVFPITRYPQRHGDPEREIRQRLKSAVFGSRTVDDRTACLAALVGACNLIPQVFEKDKRGEAKKRIKEMAKKNTYSQAVDRIVRETQAAVTVAIIAATSSST